MVRSPPHQHCPRRSQIRPVLDDPARTVGLVSELLENRSLGVPVILVGAGSLVSGCPGLGSAQPIAQRRPQGDLDAAARELDNRSARKMWGSNMRMWL